MNSGIYLFVAGPVFQFPNNLTLNEEAAELARDVTGTAANFRHSERGINKDSDRVSDMLVLELRGRGHWFHYRLSMMDPTIKEMKI